MSRSTFLRSWNTARGLLFLRYFEEESLSYANENWELYTTGSSRTALPEEEEGFGGYYDQPPWHIKRRVEK